jgi:hypothetical protein
LVSSKDPSPTHPHPRYSSNVRVLVGLLPGPGSIHGGRPASLLLRLLDEAHVCVPGGGDEGDDDGVCWEYVSQLCYLNRRPEERKTTRRKLTSNELANTPNEIQHALPEVAGKSKEAGKQADEAADKGVHDAVGGSEDGGEQLADGLDEVGYGVGDGHFGFLRFLSCCQDGWLYAVLLFDSGVRDQKLKDVNEMWLMGVVCGLDMACWLYKGGICVKLAPLTWVVA